MLQKIFSTENNAKLTLQIIISQWFVNLCNFWNKVSDMNAKSNLLLSGAFRSQKFDHCHPWTGEQCADWNYIFSYAWWGKTQFCFVDFAEKSSWHRSINKNVCSKKETLIWYHICYRHNHFVEINVWPCNTKSFGKNLQKFESWIESD